LDVFDRVYYMRALAGVAAGVIAGFVIPMEYDQYTSALVVLLIAILLYVISYLIGKEIAKNVPKEKRRKVATDGIIPFIFLLFTFMIIVYTALHQSILIK
jgi:protein-S-isoprenylcysteine O-methyltransferase Ste14